MSQFVRYIIVGVLNTLLGYSIIFACMYLLGLSAVTSNVIGYGVGLIQSYFLNKNFTFNSDSKSKLEALRFLLVFLISYLSNLGALLFFIKVAGWNEAVAQVCSSVIYVLMSYLLNKYYVFRFVER